ncbi:hypothetical protein FRC12_023266 [Ceratobasidium sp. 428]|nr:hypothetical protein FRC12_023266 [Ceratobasidium sp. 428]
MPLTYTVTKNYTIPHLTVYFSVFSFVAIVALAVLNVILQGYDIVTVLRPDPNITASYWWSTRVGSVRSAGDCDPVSLSKEMMFSTNSSLFSYKLRSMFHANKQTMTVATSYMANPLSSCTVDGILANVDLVRSTLKFDVPILCMGSDIPFSLSLISSFSIDQKNQYYDDIVAHYIRNKPSREGLELGQGGLLQRNPSDPLNTIAVIDAISSDLEFALNFVASRSTDVIPTSVATGGLLSCPGGQNATCKPEEMIMTAPRSGTTYSNGSYVTAPGVGPFLAPIERTFLNMFTALQDAFHIDLGNIQPSNTLLSKDAFAARIQPDPALSGFIQGQNGATICSWGIGCVKDTTWVDQLLASNPGLNVTIPSVLSTGNAPAVIAVDYLCPEFRLKRPGSLLTSVFIGTWSMYMALLGIFELIGPTLEKRLGRKRKTENTSGQAIDICSF